MNISEYWEITESQISEAEDVELYEIKGASRIVSACGKHGIGISLGDAYLAWKEHSGCYCAGWLKMPDDDDKLIEIVRNYVI